MNCPQCNLSFQAPADSDLPVHNCPSCGGTWIRGNALHAMLARSSAPAGIEETLDSILDLEFRESRRRCPSCNGRHLKAVIIEDTELDFCAKCKGLFFDPGELQRVFPGIIDKNQELQPSAARGFWSNLLRFIDHR